VGDKFVKGLYTHDPSFNGAISLAIYSFLSKWAIRTDIALTGEIDLRGNIKAIGGLYAKLHGAKKLKFSWY